MNRSRGFLFPASLAVLLFCSCVSLSLGYGNMATASGSSDKLATNSEVLETMDAGGYTYVRVKAEDGGEIWAAGPRTAVKVGEFIAKPPPESQLTPDPSVTVRFKGAPTPDTSSIVRPEPSWNP